MGKIFIGEKKGFVRFFGSLDKLLEVECFECNKKII